MGPLSRSAVLSALALLAALAALAPPLARGSQAAPPSPPPPLPPPPGEIFSESIDVDVVDVEVFVTDRSGRPVAGLGRGDFELRVDGKPVPITNFYASSDGLPTAPASPTVASAPQAAAPAGAPPAVPAAAPEGQRLNLVVFIDNVNLSAPGRYRALQALGRFLPTALHPGDRVLLASYDGGSLKLRRPPPGDIAATLAAFRDIASKMAYGDHGPVAAELSARDVGAEAAEPATERGVPPVALLDGERDLAGRMLLRALDRFVGSIAGLPGRKAVLYLTENLQASPGDPLFKALIRRANAEQVTLYGLGTLDPEKALTSQLDDTLYHLAAPTGGLWGVNLYNPALLLDRIRDDLGSYYSLGFAPDRPHDGRSHRLEVRVPGRQGLTVRSPASYASRPGAAAH